MKDCLLALMFAVLVSTGEVAFCEDQSGKQTTAQLNTQVEVQMSYLLYLPKGYEQQESWPLLLFLHGSGERGDDLELVKKHGPPKLIAAGQDFPFIVVSPQCPQDRRWEPIELVALLNGGAPKLTIYPEAGHDSWTETYDNPELYKWLLEQRRSKKE